MTRGTSPALSARLPRIRAHFTGKAVHHRLGLRQGVVVPSTAQQNLPAKFWYTGSSRWEVAVAREAG
jgi:hypothetical protein